MKHRVEALESLRRNLGRDLQYSDLRRVGARIDIPSATPIENRFGSWRSICELMNQPYRPYNTRRPPPNYWSNEEMIDALRRLQARRGQFPLRSTALREYKAGGRGRRGEYPSLDAVLRRFGTWPSVLEAMAGERVDP